MVWLTGIFLCTYEALAITNKRIPLTYIYCIDQHPISWCDSVKYLGLHVHSKLSWSKHCKSIFSKANRSLNCLRCSMFRCSREAKYIAYRALVCSILEYAAVVWCPHATGDIKLLESLQGRAACWICSSRWSPTTSSWTVPTHDCCSQLCLPTLQSRRQYLSVCFLHDIYCKRVPISFSKYCTFNPASSTRSHCLSLLPPISTINDISCFVNTTFLWNSIPLNILQQDNISSFRHSLYNYSCITT